MKKRKIILLIFLILIFLILIGIIIFQKQKPSPRVPKEEIPKEEIFGFTGTLLKTDPQNNLLIIRPTGKKEEIKIILTKETKVFRLEYPPAKEGTIFKLERKEIRLEGIKENDRIFVKTKTNIAGLKEFNDVDYIEVFQ